MREDKKPKELIYTEWALGHVTHPSRLPVGSWNTDGTRW